MRKGEAKPCLLVWLELTCHPTGFLGSESGFLGSSHVNSMLWGCSLYGLSLQKHGECIVDEWGLKKYGMTTDNQGGRSGLYVARRSTIFPPNRQGSNPHRHFHMLLTNRNKLIWGVVSLCLTCLLWLYRFHSQIPSCQLGSTSPQASHLFLGSIISWVPSFWALMVSSLLFQLLNPFLTCLLC